MPKATTQTGGSNRGPAALDRAKKNRGVSPEADRIPESQRGLASGRTAGEEKAQARPARGRPGKPGRA